MTAVQGSILGNEVLRREDPALLTGTEQYFDDIAVEGVAHVHFVRSTVAHAAIESIDISAAAEAPGVVGVFTADDLDLAPMLGNSLFPKGFAMPPLARGKVRLVGDIIAVVVAATRAEAEDAAELVWMDFEPLPVVTDMEAALAADAPMLFEDVGTNVCYELGLGTEDGDPVAGAEHVTELRIVSQRLAAVPIEPNGILVIPDGDRLTVWLPSQNPVSARDSLADALGLEPETIRVAAPAVGGGFGPKSGVYPEHVITARLAGDLGRPLKWTEGRSENMLSLAQGRAMTIRVRLGLDQAGVITGMDVDLVADAGAYPATGAFLISFTQTMVQGVYRIPKLRFHARAVATNTSVTGAYRGAGRPEATQFLERVVDLAADELGIDPAELRRRNLIGAEELPLITHGGAHYDSGDYEMALDTALELVGYEDLLVEQAERRRAGDRKLLGVGMSSYVEVTAPAGLHVEWGGVEVGPDGRVVARVGTSAHGQGHVTAFSMILSELLGVSMDDITVLQSDTDHIPKGAGTMGSRSLQTAGSALHVAGTAVLTKAKQLAAHLLEASAGDIVTGEGGLHVAGVPANALTWAELAAAAGDAAQRPEGMEAGLAHELDFDGIDATFPFGAHVAVVEVDAETGAVTLLRHVAVDDCGRILNPLLVRGQQHGGIAQGAAQALYEAVQYDDEGNPLTGNLMDYAIPSAAELPFFETHTTETPTPRNPLGAKGIGESGTIGSTPAIHNAVIDAVSHLGVRHIDMPLTPMNVWNALPR